MESKEDLGQLIRVSDNSISYQGKFSGQFGRLVKSRRFSSREYRAVKLINQYNERSTTGLFWFHPEEIWLIEEKTGCSIEAVNMKEEPTMFENYKAVGVTFADGNQMECTYALFDDSIILGDVVVVHTAHHGLKVAKITSLDGDVRCITNGREIVCKVDLEPYKARKERAARRQELKSQMDKRVSTIQQTAIYDMLAEKDEGLAAMLKEYKELSGNN